MKVGNFMVEVIAEVEGKKQGTVVQEFQHPQYGTIVEGNGSQTYSLRLTNNTQDIMGAKFWIDGQHKGTTTTLRQQKPKVLKGLTLSKDIIHESKPSEESGVIRVSFYPVEMKEKKKVNTTENQETSSTKRSGPKFNISSNSPVETISIRYFPKESLAQLGFVVNSGNTSTQTNKSTNPKKRQKKSAADVPSSNNNNNNNISTQSSDQFPMDISALMYANQPNSHDTRYIWISVRNFESKSVAISYFLVLKGAPLKYLQQSYSNQHGVPSPTFVLNGTPLPTECTPDQLGLKDGTVLQVSFHGTSADPTQDESEATIVLRARYKQMALRFKINKDDTLSKLMDAFCRKKSIDPNAVVFTFDGFPIQGSSTVKSLHLENEDLIEVLSKEAAEKQAKPKHESHKQQHQYSPPPPHVMTYPYPTNATTAAYLQAMQSQSAPFMFYRQPDVFQENHDG